MPTQVACPSCSQQLRVPDDLMGREVKCPKCGTTFVGGAIAETATATLPGEPNRAVSEGVREERESPLPPRREEHEPSRPSRRLPPDLDDDFDDDDDYEPRRRRSFAAHRGGLILTFGILGLVFLFLCGLPVFSVPALIMGHIDLKAMRQGQMDPDGRGMTMAGYIMGIIGTGLFVLAIIGLIIALAVG
ncbi:MAG TPA: DUF4190 domain-containing protein [Gemmataceae bacterium]|nr:DUF4190 domain-containing protein [Gemmataceae bacterium]